MGGDQLGGVCFKNSKRVKQGAICALEREKEVQREIKRKKKMRTPSIESSSRRSSYSRGCDFPEGRSSYSRGCDFQEGLPDSRDYGIGGAMLPIFLNDLSRNNQQDFVEVTLELEDDAIVLCSVTPTSRADPNGDEAVGGFLSRSLSATSRIRRKFSWLRSASSRTSCDEEEPTILARDARKQKAKLERTRSSAQRALKGLRFINKTTGAQDANELWKKVESRFESLAKDRLLSREDFGECIGNLDYDSSSLATL